ncbi:MAG: 3-dehydroquinate dehydratase-2 [Pelagibacterales bacterium]|jgi:3-dehydroquinate dehydratase-2|nr:3-dehydroquinate dehydratase-2 [Pelagibacterales bacterium]
MKNKIIVINGPNLNLLGEREKEKYGEVSLKNIEEDCIKYGKNNNLDVTFFQSNIEGDLVNTIQESRNDYRGVIINAAGYTHTSVSIRDALSILKTPIIELHITNIYKREEFRHKSLISDIATSVICGFGVKGYIIALEGMKDILLK